MQGRASTSRNRNAYKDSMITKSKPHLDGADAQNHCTPISPVFMKDDFIT